MANPYQGPESAAEWRRFYRQARVTLPPWLEYFPQDTAVREGIALIGQAIKGLAGPADIQQAYTRVGEARRRQHWTPTQLPLQVIHFINAVYFMLLVLKNGEEETSASRQTHVEWIRSYLTIATDPVAAERHRLLLGMGLPDPPPASTADIRVPWAMALVRLHKAQATSADDRPY